MINYFKSAAFLRKLAEIYSDQTLYNEWNTKNDKDAEDIRAIEGEENNSNDQSTPVSPTEKKIHKEFIVFS